MIFEIIKSRIYFSALDSVFILFIPLLVFLVKNILLFSNPPLRQKKSNNLPEKMLFKQSCESSKRKSCADIYIAATFVVNSDR